MKQIENLEIMSSYTAKSFSDPFQRLKIWRVGGWRGWRTCVGNVGDASTWATWLVC